ncbi:hypothetical protein DFH94DRAFT_7427 [Russula ochroleuca]|uniref:Secreted protein n=1 Tax=Russula ochroleuca TaxID=152965 RepID=A0A9P5N5Z7_9AGAM|nr:hypothetical protein DFH94DRAFT_7427 [Russula ochroleuca]
MTRWVSLSLWASAVEASGDLVNCEISAFVSQLLTKHRWSIISSYRHSIASNDSQRVHPNKPQIGENQVTRSLSLCGSTTWLKASISTSQV